MRWLAAYFVESAERVHNILVSAIHRIFVSLDVQSVQ